MSVLVAAKLNGQVVLGTDSRTMDASFQSPLSDATQKVFELAPGVFYATNGYRHLSEWQPAQAQALARDLGTTDIRAIADALDAISLPRLEELAVKVTEASSLASEHADAASGAQPIHAYILAGVSRGVPGFVARKSKITDGRIVTQSDEIFDLPEDQLRCWLTRAKLVEPITTNPWTWQWGAAAGVERLIAEISARHPQVGGPVQMAMIDSAGARWIHQPQVMPIETDQALAGNSVVDRNIVDMSLPKLTAGVCIFTDDAVFSRGSGKPVMVLNNGGLYLFGEANSLGNPPGGGGLTSKPHVIVQNTGISLMSGGDRAVTVNSSAITLWAKNADATQPYVTITSSSVDLKASTTSASLTPGFMRLYNGSCEVRMDVNSTAHSASAYLEGTNSDSGYNFFASADSDSSAMGVSTPYNFGAAVATLQSYVSGSAGHGRCVLAGTDGGVHVNGYQVIGARKTGWSAPSGTASRASFDTSTVTTAQLAQRLKALLDDLTAHGTIGA